MGRLVDVPPAPLHWGRRAACSVGFKVNLQYLEHLLGISTSTRPRTLQDKEKRGRIESPSSPDGVTAGPIYLMLGLPALDQSAAGDEPSSGPSPNTFPTLLGPGIALALALALRPSPPSGPKKTNAVICAFCSRQRRGSCQ